MALVLLLSAVGSTRADDPQRASHPAYAGEALPQSPRRAIGELEGTPGEAEAGYPYGGWRTGGSASLKSLVQSGFDGSAFELQLDDTLPRSLILQHIRLWAGHAGTSQIDVTWDQPTEDDARFDGRYRDFRNIDLGFLHSSSRWFDRPSEQPSLSTLDRGTFRLRKFERLHVDGLVEELRITRRSIHGDRDSRNQRVRANGQARVGSIRADMTVETSSYADALNPTDGHEDTHLKLRLGRDIGPNTHLRMAAATQERKLDTRDSAQRDLTLSLSTRTYDLFDRRGLKLKTEASYTTRSSSFQITQDDDENYRLGFQLAYDIGPGAIEGGFRSTKRETIRLDRRGIEVLLATPGTPRAELLSQQQKFFPEERRAWISATLPVKDKARAYFGFDDRNVHTPPGTDWVSEGSGPLEYTSTRKSRYGITVFPWEGVDLTAERTLSERTLSSRGDHLAGQRQRVEHAFVNVHLSFLPRTDLNFQASNFDIRHGSDVIRAGSVEETSNYGMDFGYSLSRSLTLESSYQRLNHDGTNGATQDVVGFAVDLDASRTGNIRLEYTLDDFLDQEEGASSAKARIFSVTGELKF